MAEEAAWKFAKENRIDLVTINPGFVIGPLIQPTLNLTVETFLNETTGTFVAANPFYCLIIMLFDREKNQLSLLRSGPL